MGTNRLRRGAAKRVIWTGAATGLLVGILLPFDAIAATPGPAPGSPPVTLSGRVFTPDGAPASGLTVTLSRDIGAASTIGGLFGTIFSLGLACIYHDVKLCQQNSYPATTRPDGSYGITLPGEVGSVTLRESDKFIFAVALPAAAGETSGPSASATFNISQARVAMPDIHLWRAAVKVTGDKLHGHVNFVATNPPVSQYGITFTGATGGAIYSTTTSGPSGDFDARLLEDAQGTVSASASVAAPSAISVTYHSPGSAFTGTAGPPPSRGKPCAFQQGSQPVAALAPCTLTDGDFTKAFQAAAVPACVASPLPLRPTQQDSQKYQQAQAECARQRQGAVIIDMGSSSQSIGMVVVRGSAGALQLQTSNDEHNWTTITSTGSRTTPSATTLKAGVKARYLRLQSATAMPGVTEVSVWPSLLPDPGSGPFAGLFGSGKSRSQMPGGTMLVLVFAILALAVGAGAGAYAAIRSRSRVGSVPPQT